MRLRRDSLFCRFLFRNQKFPLLRSGNSAFAPAAQIDSFFKASPASGAALKDKGLKLKSEHRKNIIVIVLIVVVTIVTFAFALVFAGILSREQIRGQNFFRIIFYIPNILSVVVIEGIFSAIY